MTYANHTAAELTMNETKITQQHYTNSSLHKHH